MKIKHLITYGLMIACLGPVPAMAVHTRAEYKTFSNTRTDTLSAKEESYLGYFSKTGFYNFFSWVYYRGLYGAQPELHKNITDLAEKSKSGWWDHYNFKRAVLDALAEVPESMLSEILTALD